jgi:hypothetical protein
LTLEFNREGYGAGDEVVAQLSARTPAGGPAMGASASAVARVEAVEVFRGEFTTGADGDVAIRFTLPNVR